MSRQAVERLMDLWVNDPRFRERMRRDPEGAARAAGIELDAEAWAALRAVDRQPSDEELEKRYYGPAGPSGAGG